MRDNESACQARKFFSDDDKNAQRDIVHGHRHPGRLRMNDKA